LDVDLGLWFRRRKLSGLLLVPKSGRFVGTVAKWLTRRVPTTAQSDGGTSGEAIRLTLHVDDFEIPFDAQRTIISNSNLR